MKLSCVPILFICLLLSNCKKGEKHYPITKVIDTPIVYPDSLINKDTWQFKDVIDDSIPGISLEKAKKTILKNKTQHPIIVAVIDGRFDFNHLALKGFIWKNPNETLNYLDDDGNGFVDDLYGWNFMGDENGVCATSANQEYVRIVRLYKDHFKDKTLENIRQEEVNDFKLYVAAKEKLENELIETQEEIKWSILSDETYVKSKNALKYWFPDYNYNLETLSKIDTISNPELAIHVKEISDLVSWGGTDILYSNYTNSLKEKYNKELNIDFNDRELVGDNPYDINDTIYGNNRIFEKANVFDHGTRVSSVVAGVFNSPEKLKIMPLSKSPLGDHYSKDLALAIRYAVNNGAKVINMSFGRYFSLNNQWVLDAIKYAEEHNVLLVKSAGNSSYDIDKKTLYPNDKDEQGNEVADNLLTVGASSYSIDENLRAYFSCYGLENVDLFAPGNAITTAFPNHNTYGFPLYHEDAGTSLSAALTSGAAAFLYSYYPNLTASQVKHILMDSGVEYTIPVSLPTEDNEDNKIPFNKLSKSGKILNIYNALIMADSISSK